MLLEYSNGCMTPFYILISISMSHLIVAISAQRVTSYSSLLDGSFSLKRTCSATLQPIDHTIGYSPLLIESFFVRHMLFSQ